MSMATSSSCASSLAPTDFQFSSSLESADDIAVAVERCPLCRGSTRPFICDKCVTSGIFIHSSHQQIERYVDKKERWDYKRKERDRILERFKLAYKNIQEICCKKTTINATREKIEILHEAIKAEKDALLSGRQKLTKLQESNSARSLKSKSRRQRVEKIAEYLSHIRHKKVARASILVDVMRELAQCRRALVKRLASTVFTVHSINLTQESLAVSVVSGLKDAMHTAHIKERWVYADLTSGLGYNVVASTMSTTGDYSVCSVLVTDTARMTTPDPSLLKLAHETLAGLAYLAQLTMTLAYILDVNLLRKVSYSDFCGQTVTWPQFTNYVARLNHNVTYLCVTQGVALTTVNPRHTVQSLLALVSATHLGRKSSFDVHSRLFESLDDEIDQSDDSDDDVPTNDGEDDGLDWERVPHELPEAPPCCDASNMDTVDTGTASSIMTSAAASVMSLWRVATSPFERR